jgi:thiamine-monophosphate kinase
MLVQGRHFFQGVAPYTLGHKALAVNLSDLAACGARPVAFSLALALPDLDEVWLSDFSAGLFALADAHNCELVGGDTTRGPLNICITVFGEVPLVDGRTQALLRSGAQPGDDLYVSGTVGDARLALDTIEGRLNVPADVLTAALVRLQTPTPRVALGLALRGVATSAIDISDGLLGDLRHILERSGVGAVVNAEETIKSIAAYTNNTRAGGQSVINLSNRQWRQLALAGGDDYELLFTAAPQRRAAVETASLASKTVVRRIGEITREPGLTVLDAQGQPLAEHYASFDHFA